MTQPDPTPLDRRDCSRLLLGASVAAAVSYWVLAQPPAWAAILVLALGGGALWKRRFWMIGAAAALGFAWPVVEGIRWGPVWEFGVQDLAAALALLMMIMLTLKHLELDPRRFAWRNPFPSPTPAEVERHASDTAALTPLPGSLGRAPAAVALAALALTWVPESRFMSNRYYFDPSVIRAIVIGWLLLAAVVVPAGLMSLIRWRRLSPHQAALYLRSQLDEDVPELRSIERSRSRAAARRAARRNTE